MRNLFSPRNILPVLLLIALTIAGCSGGVVTGLQNYYGHPADVTPPWLNATPEDVCVWGDYAYVAAGTNGVHIYDISNPSNPVWVHWVETGDAVVDIDVRDRYVYTIGERKFYVIDISAPQSAHITAEIDVPGDLHAMVVEGSRAYIATREAGLQIVDLSIPKSPSLQSSLDLDGRAYNIAVEGDYAAVAVQAYSGYPYYRLKIVTLKDKESPCIVGEIGFQQSIYSLKLYDGYVYVGNIDGLYVVDITSPSSPHIVFEMKSIRVYGLRIQGTYAYVSGAQNKPYPNDPFFSIFDISNPSTPEIVSSENINAPCRNMDVQNGYVFMACSTGLQVLDTTSLSSLEIVYSSYITPRLFDDFTVDDGYAYYVYESLQIFKISPPESARYIMTLALPGSACAVDVKEGYAYVVHTGGMSIIDVDPPETASIVKTVAVKSGNHIIVKGENAYVTAGPGNIYVIDIDPAESAHIVGLAELPFSAHPDGIAVTDGYAYMIYSTDGFEWEFLGLGIFDVDPPESAHFVCWTPVDSRTVVAENGYAFTWVDDGLAAIKVVPPQEVEIYKSIKLPNWINPKALDDGYFYSTGSEGFIIIDVDPVDSARPVW